MQTIQLLGTAMGIGFVSGINLYATVLVIGLGVNAGLIHLSPHLSGLATLGHPLVLLVASALYVVEFLADKIPWVDTAWDTIHTFVRPLGAAVIATSALGAADPAVDVVVWLLAGSVAFSTHATKAGVRLLVNASPEPFSNVALSLAEDAVAVAGSWFVLRYPVVAGVLVSLFVIAVLLAAPRLYGALRIRGLAMGGLVRAWFVGERPAGDLFDEVPRAYGRALPPAFGQPGDFALRCVTGRGPGVPAGRIGYLCLAGDRLLLLTRPWVAVRQHAIEVGRLDEVRVERSGLFERLVLRAGASTTTLYFFRDRRAVLVQIARRLDAARAVAVAATG